MKHSLPSAVHTEASWSVEVEKREGGSKMGCNEAMADWWACHTWTILTSTPDRPLEGPQRGSGGVGLPAPPPTSPSPGCVAALSSGAGTVACTSPVLARESDARRVAPAPASPPTPAPPTPSTLGPEVGSTRSSGDRSQMATLPKSSPQVRVQRSEEKQSAVIAHPLSN
ncbi:MAG: hypothetical protein SGPRY_001482 [Prymnesium sp.]